MTLKMTKSSNKVSVASLLKQNYILVFKKHWFDNEFQILAVHRKKDF